MFTTKCVMTSHRYGDVTGRYVIYQKDSAEVEDVQYLNVEEYLKLLQEMKTVIMKSIY